MGCKEDEGEGRHSNSQIPCLICLPGGCHLLNAAGCEMRFPMRLRHVRRVNFSMPRRSSIRLCLRSSTRSRVSEVTPSSVSSLLLSRKRQLHRSFWRSDSLVVSERGAAAAPCVLGLLYILHSPQVRQHAELFVNFT